MADAFLLMRFPFESDEARQLNKDIFETIYYSALKASCELAERLGPYETYEGSPVSQGVSTVTVLCLIEKLSDCINRIFCHCCIVMQTIISFLSEKLLNKGSIVKSL